MSATRLACGAGGAPASLCWSSSIVWYKLSRTCEIEVRHRPSFASGEAARPLRLFAGASPTGLAPFGSHRSGRGAERDRGAIAIGRVLATRPRARSRGPAVQRPGDGTLDPFGVRPATRPGETRHLRPDRGAQGPAVPSLPAVLPSGGLAPSRSDAPATAPVEGRPLSRRDGPEPRSRGNRRTERDRSPFGCPRPEAAGPSRRACRRTRGGARGGRSGRPGSRLRLPSRCASHSRACFMDAGRIAQNAVRKALQSSSRHRSASRSAHLWPGRRSVGRGGGAAPRPCAAGFTFPGERRLP